MRSIHASVPIPNVQTPDCGIKQVATRYYGLDALRASMLLLGIVFHLALPYAGVTLPGYYITDERSRPLQFVLLLHYFRMPIFFFLSGFFSALIWERGGAREFLRIRSQRIGLVWVLSLAILSPMMATISSYNHFASKGSNHALISTWRGIRSLQIDTSWLPDAPLHLWFLEYLMLFCLAAAAILSISKSFPLILDRWTQRVIGWRLRIFALAVPTMVTLWYMPLAVMPYPTSFVPWFGVSFAYGWFYVVGWLLYRQRNGLSLLVSRAQLEKVAAPFLIIICLLLMKESLKYSSGTIAFMLHIAITFSTALFIWATIIAFIAALHNFKPSKWLIYLADSSYWIYLMHYPLALLMPAILRHWSVSPVIKVAISAAFIFSFLLLTYDQFVRYTAIGRLLNGSKHDARTKVLLGSAGREYAAGK